jgi:hypothetical protein
MSADIAGEPLPPLPPEPAPRALPTQGAAGEAPASASFWAHEGALLALSLVLALMAWYLVRQTIHVEKLIRVKVEFVVPPDSQVFAGDEVTFRLVGKQGEVEAVAKSVESGREKVRLAIGPLELNQVFRPIRAGDDTYRLPFPDRLLEDPARPPLPSGEVVKVRRERVTVTQPKVAEPLPHDWPQGVKVELEVLTPSIEVLAPAEAFDGPLVPDDVDLTPYRETASGLSAPVEVVLGFQRWRAEGGERVRRRRAAVALPEVKALVRFVLHQSDSITGPVMIAIKPGWVVTDIRSTLTGKFTNTTNPQGLGGREQPTFTGEVRATRDLLGPLKSRGDLWRWVLRVGDADLPTGSDATQLATALLSLETFESLAGPQAQGYIVFTPLQVPVEVRKVR